MHVDEHGVSDPGATIAWHPFGRIQSIRFVKYACLRQLGGKSSAGEHEKRIKKGRVSTDRTVTGQ